MIVKVIVPDWVLIAEVLMIWSFTETVTPSTTPKVITVDEPGDTVVVTLGFSGDKTAPLSKSVPDTLTQLVAVVTDNLIVTGSLPQNKSLSDFARYQKLLKHCC